MFMNLDRRLFSDVKICSPDLAHFFVVNREIERERERERIHEKHYIFNVIVSPLSCVMCPHLMFPYLVCFLSLFNVIIS